MATDTMLTHTASRPPDWALVRPKSAAQSMLDLVAAPLRMILLPDEVCERWHITSLRGERFAAVLPQLRGRVLDVGAGDNVLIKLYRERIERDGGDLQAAADSVGVDVVDWGADTMLIDRADKLPFEAKSFDTVSFVACLNHIPERVGALTEACRVLKPGGRVVITMIGRTIGVVGHKLWWYSEDKHREVAQGEVMGMDGAEVMGLIARAGFREVRNSGFVYGLNRLFVGIKPTAA